MRVLFAASECAPMVKVGGLGDVIGSLPKALKKIGVETAVILPRYEIVHTAGLKLAVADFPVTFRNKIESVKVYRGFLPKTKVPVFYVENNKYLSRGGPVYFSRTAVASESAEFDRFHFFSHAVYELLAFDKLPFQPDILHANDWHAGVLIRLLKLSSLKLPSVFSIHNLGNQGIFRGRNSMAEGIAGADLVNTVSPTYAKEIQTKEYGVGLDDLFKKKKPFGILNGIDYDILKNKFSKKKTKLNLQKELKLSEGGQYPLFGLVSRLVEQKGIHLITPIIGRLIEKHQAQFIFLGVGGERYEKELEDLAKKFPKNVSANLFFSEELADKIYIAGDFFLMPSLFEPCGLGQMIAMHYQTIPIARKTGGLKDTVREGKTGFVFSGEKPEDLRRAVERAIKLFYNKKEFAALRKSCGEQDFSWDKSAVRYKDLYKKLI
jgi:starch synthase